MPLSPTAAQADASRLNGARSRGPATAAGRARSAGNGASHGLRAGGGTLRLLPGEDRAGFRALLADLAARHAPADAAERHCVEQIAFAMWRELRLSALEAAALVAATREIEGGSASGAPAEGAGARRQPPSLATLARYRARLERDERRAADRLADLRRSRQRPPARPAATPPLADGTDEPDGAAPPSPPRPPRAEARGTNEPEFLARALRADPACTDEPDAPAPAPAPNRRERRRLAALGRHRARAAA